MVADLAIHLNFKHGFKNRIGERTGKESSSSIYGQTSCRIGSIINNFKII